MTNYHVDYNALAPLNQAGFSNGESFCEYLACNRDTTAIGKIRIKTQRGPRFKEKVINSKQKLDFVDGLLYYEYSQYHRGSAELTPAFVRKEPDYETKSDSFEIFKC